MKNALVLSLCLICSVAAWSQSASEKNGVKFVEQPLEALVSANNNDTRPIMVWIWSGYCGACKRMQREVWNNPSTAAFFNRYFVNVSINIDNEESVMQNEKLLSYIEPMILPRIVFYNPNGRSIESMVGCKNEEEMRQLAKMIIEDNNFYFKK